MLFDVLDLSHEEIRKIQGGTLSGVKSRIRRGRAELSKKLGVEEKMSHQTAQRKPSHTVPYLIPTGCAK